MGIEYVATEFAGDPPSPIGRWYKVEAGTYARYGPDGVEFFTAEQLKIEQPLGTAIEFVPGDENLQETTAVELAWQARR